MAALKGMVEVVFVRGDVVDSFLRREGFAIYSSQRADERNGMIDVREKDSVLVVGQLERLGASPEVVSDTSL